MKRTSKNQRPNSNQGGQFGVARMGLPPLEIRSNPFEWTEEDDLDVTVKMSTQTDLHLPLQTNPVPLFSTLKSRFVSTSQDTMLPPAPLGRTSQPELVLESVLRPSSLVDTLADEFQAVRTSMPPPLLVIEKAQAASWLKVLLVIGVFVVAVSLMFSTPRTNGHIDSTSQAGIFTGSSFQTANAIRHALPLFASSVASGEMITHLDTPSAHLAAEVAAVSRPRAHTDGGPSLAAKHSDWRNRIDGAEAEMPATEAGATDAVPEPLNPNASSTALLSAAGASNSAELQNASVGPTVDPPKSRPVIPSREVVLEAMNRLAPKVAKCQMGTSGRMVMRLSVSGASGRVVSAKILDPVFSGTSTGRCAIRAARHVRLPGFTQRRLDITYPFEL